MPYLHRSLQDGGHLGGQARRIPRCSVANRLGHPEPEQGRLELDRLVVGHGALPLPHLLRDGLGQLDHVRGHGHEDGHVLERSGYVLARLAVPGLDRPLDAEDAGARRFLDGRRRLVRGRSKRAGQQVVVLPRARLERRTKTGAKLFTAARLERKLDV